MEAVELGRPLSFLDSHVQRGNALLGATPELMKKGVPDAAFEPIEGDDKKTASLLKRRNKSAAEGQRGFDALWSRPAEKETAEVVQAVSALDAAQDADLAAVAGKEARWAELQGSEAYRHQLFVADAWCAAFVWPKPVTEPKTSAPLVEAAPTNELWRQMRDGQGNAPELSVKTVERLVAQYHFFHWHLAFPQVFARGGFDVVLGNPPWERVKLQEQEFFASRHATIAGAVNSAARKKLIASLPKENPALWTEWVAASRWAEGQSHFMRQSDRYPLCGKGDVNTYAIFAEHNRSILGPTGRAGFIVPTGIATDEGTSAFLRALVTDRSLQQIVSFENEGTTFGGVNNRQSFCLFTISRAPVARSRLIFNVNQPLPENAGPLDFELAPEDFALFNPNTGNCPTFRTRRDAAINITMYRRAGVLWKEDDPAGNPWNIRFMAMLHMANDSGLFRSRADLEGKGDRLVGNVFEGPLGRHLPLIEAKMMSAFDHRFGTYEGATQAHYNKGFLPRFSDADHADANKVLQPDMWVAESEVTEILGDRWARGWFLGWRDICRRTDVRTVIAALIPRAAVGDKFPLMLSAAETKDVAALYGNLCSFALDYAARQKVGGTSLKYFTMRQLPVLPPAAYEPGPDLRGEMAAWRSRYLRESVPAPSRRVSGTSPSAATLEFSA